MSEAPAAQRLDSSQAFSFARNLRAVERQVLAVQKLVRGGLGSSTRTASLRGSVSSTSLTRTGSATVLRSSAEVNTASTSWTAVAHALSGASTAAVKLGGTYSGSTDTTLRFRITSNAVVGATGFNVQMRQGGTILETLSVGASYTPGTELGFSNGLKIAFGAGTVANAGGIDINVSASVPGAFDPTRVLGGTNTQDPHFDEGFGITNGSFLLNGVSIAVSTSDTLNDVLSRINSSSADVLATWDAASEGVILTRTTEGAEAITLASDSSGLLAALKLDPGDQTLGELDEVADIAIAGHAAFASVIAGSFTLNGTLITVDPSTDTIEDLLARMEAAGTRATWNEDSGELRLSAATRGGSITLSGDSSGLLSAMGIDEGDYEGQSGSSRHRKLSAALTESTASLQSLLGEPATGPLQGVRAVVANAILGRFEQGDDKLSTVFGMRFDREALGSNGGSTESQPIVHFGRTGERTLGHALGAPRRQVRAALIGASNNRADGGFLGDVLAAVRRAQDRMGDEYSVGSLLSVRA